MPSCCPHWEEKENKRTTGVRWKKKKKRGHFEFLKYLRSEFLVHCKALCSHFVACLKNKETDEWNEWLCIGVVNPMDGYMSFFFPPKKKIMREKKISTAPPPVFKMTVNFPPLLQNGCLMINRGSALRILQSRWLCVCTRQRKLPPRCHRGTLCLKRG